MSSEISRTKFTDVNTSSTAQATSHKFQLVKQRDRDYSIVPQIKPRDGLVPNLYWLLLLYDNMLRCRLGVDATKSGYSYENSITDTMNVDR